MNLACNQIIIIPKIIAMLIVKQFFIILGPKNSLEFFLMLAMIDIKELAIIFVFLLAMLKSWFA